MTYDEWDMVALERGVILHSHGPSVCAAQPWGCWIHNPVQHSLSDAPVIWREDRAIAERLCEHGIGHPDWQECCYQLQIRSRDVTVHGCDGCCLPVPDGLRRWLPGRTGLGPKTLYVGALPVGRQWLPAGWTDLVQGVLEQAADIVPGVDYGSAKEKFGRLVLALRWPGPPNEHLAEDRYRVNDLVRAAEERSVWICDQCGGEGELFHPEHPEWTTGPLGAHRTRCLQHRHVGESFAEFAVRGRT